MNWISAIMRPEKLAATFADLALARLSRNEFDESAKWRPVVERRDKIDARDNLFGREIVSSASHVINSFAQVLIESICVVN